MRPSFSIAGKLITSEVQFDDQAARKSLGIEYSVRIELPYGERYSGAIQKGTKFRLQAGGKVIARGEVTSIFV